MAEMNQQDMRDRLGNVDQIRDILFGTQLRNYEQRIEKLEAESAEMRQEMHNRFDQMQNSLTGELKSIADSLEKKLKYLSLTTHDETTKLWQKLEQSNQKNYTILETLNKTFSTKTSSLREELNQTQEQFQLETQTLKAKIFEELEKCFSTLRDAKVSRVDLAEVLFELCIKVKGTEFVPDLKEAMENHLQTDFLLPEEEQSQSQTSPSSGITQG